MSNDTAIYLFTMATGGWLLVHSYAGAAVTALGAIYFMVLRVCDAIQKAAP